LRRHSPERPLFQRNRLNGWKPDNLQIILIVADNQRSVVPADGCMIRVWDIEFPTSDQVNRKRSILMQKLADLVQGHGRIVQALPFLASAPRFLRSTIRNTGDNEKLRVAASVSELAKSSKSPDSPDSPDSSTVFPKDFLRR
jgi:hypothetical protein